MIEEWKIEQIPDDRAFCRLCNQLLNSEFRTGLTLSPTRGPDGGRDATLELGGQFWIFQYKYVPREQRLSNLFKTLSIEIDRLVERHSFRKIDRYILMTNSQLSRTMGSGFIDKLEQKFKRQYPEIAQETWNAPMIAAKMNNNPILRDYFSYEEEAKSKTKPFIEGLAYGSLYSNISLLKDKILEVEAEYKRNYDPINLDFRKWLERRLRTLILQQDAKLMLDGEITGFFGVDEGMVLFGIDAYRCDKDFADLIEGQKLIARKGGGIFHGGWIYVLPVIKTIQEDDPQIDFLAELALSQVEVGGQIGIITTSRNRLRGQYLDFMVVPGKGALLYDQAWSNCQVIGRSSLCFDLVQIYRDTLKESLIIHRSYSREVLKSELTRLIQGYN